MPTDIDKLQVMLELDAGITEAYQGTPLARALPEGVNLKEWDLTFEDDFSDVAGRVTNNGGAGPWFANGTYASTGRGTHATVSTPAEPIYTQEAEGIGLGVRRDAGVAHWSANITTAHYGASMDDEPTISFAQQYGYFECRMRPADPTANGGANALLWPAFWLYSLSSLGGSTGNLGWKAIELDIAELYLSNLKTETFQNDTAHHWAVHFHEPRKWIAPGVWGRDVFNSSIRGIASNPIWGTDADFQFWQDFHDYGMLLTPEWIIVFLDGLELGRMPVVEEVHQKYYLLVSHQLKDIAPVGMPAGVKFTTVVEHVKVWQNPDWQTTQGPVLDRGALASQGDPNFKAFTTGRPLRSYARAHGRTFVIESSEANTGPVTASVNALGGRAVYKVVESLRPREVVPLAAGDIQPESWIGLRFDAALDHGKGAWVLVNPGYSMRLPETYVPAPVNPPTTTIDVETVEAGLAEKHSLPGDLFPLAHPARQRLVTETDTPPRMPISATHVLSTAITAGDPIGQLAVSNSPTRPVRYSLTNRDGSASTHFAIDPSSGRYTVAPGVADVPVGIYDLAVTAWPTRPQPIVPGSNSTHVRIDVREDDLFDMYYFEQRHTLQVLFDAQDQSRLEVDAGRLVGARDGSRFGRDLVQPDVRLRPRFSHDGLNGLPAVVSRGTKNVMRLLTPPLPRATLANIVVKPHGVMSVLLHGTDRVSPSFDYGVAHLGAFMWSPGACEFWLNGAPLGLREGGSSSITTSGAVFWVMEATDAGEGGLGRLYEGGRMFNDESDHGALHAAVGEFAIVTQELDETLIDKTFGSLAHRWRMTDALPAAHPSRTEPPYAWR